MDPWSDAQNLTGETSTCEYRLKGKKFWNNFNMCLFFLSSKLSSL